MRPFAHSAYRKTRQKGCFPEHFGLVQRLLGAWEQHDHVSFQIHPEPLMFLRFSLVFLTAIAIAALSIVSPPRLMKDLYSPASQQEKPAKPAKYAKPATPSSEFNIHSEVAAIESTAAPEVFAAPILDEVITDSVDSDFVSEHPQENLVTPNNDCQPMIHHDCCTNQPSSGSIVQYNAASQQGIMRNHSAGNINNLNLFQYRRLMLSHSAPQLHELQGTWRGVNTGIATLAIDKRFIKQFHSVGGQIYGDNISVHQNGGQPIYDRSTGGFKRAGKFLVQNPRGIGAFRHGAVLSYRRGGNRLFDPANLIEDKLVKLDDNRMLGRATANFGPIKIPLAFFVLERIQ